VGGVCKSLDGINLFVITPTSSGKTSYYTMYMLVTLAIFKDPTLCLTAKFPKNPCLIVICPTIPLQLEMVSTELPNAIREIDTSKIIYITKFRTE
jgi:hypothetical protein